MRFVWLVALFGVASGVSVATREVATELKVDDCQKFISIKETDNQVLTSKPWLQVDDGYCEANCKKGYCPKESCKCDLDFVPPDPVKPKNAYKRALSPTEIRAEAAIKDADEARKKAEAEDASGAEAAAAEREALATAAEEAREQRDAELAKAAQDRLDEAEKARLATTPVSAADAAANAVDAAADATAAAADAAAAPPPLPTGLPVLAVPAAVPEVSPLAAAVPVPAAAAVPEAKAFDASSCKGSFVAIKQLDANDNALFTQPDDAYCDANCNGGFCPEDKCRCSTDVCEKSCAKSGKGSSAMCELSECKDCTDCKATAAIVRKRGLGRHQWR